MTSKWLWLMRPLGGWLVLRNNSTQLLLAIYDCFDATPLLNIRFVLCMFEYTYMASNILYLNYNLTTSLDVLAYHLNANRTKPNDVYVWVEI